MLLRLNFLPGMKGALMHRTASPTTAASRTFAINEAVLESSRKRTRWLDVSPFKRNGKTYDGVWESAPVVAEQQAAIFPPLEVYTLDHKTVSCPQDYDGDVKVVFMSGQQYGFASVRKWMDPFIRKYPIDSISNRQQTVSGKSIVTLELSIAELGFLSIAKRMFANNIKAILPENRDPSLTVLKFGGLNELGQQMDLPHRYTNYVFVLDKNNKIRWKNIGEPMGDDLKRLYSSIEQVSAEK